MISDWNMEPMTGFDLLRACATIRRSEATPFIMVTAESKTENVIAAKKAGVNNYIVKPFNAQTLKNKIEAIFAEKVEFTPASIVRQIFTRRARASPLSAQRRQRQRSALSAAISGRVARAVFLGMDARGHEHIIDAEGGGALEIGAHRIADREHAAACRRRPPRDAAAAASATS